jgi:hypothetical protein
MLPLAAFSSRQADHGIAKIAPDRYFHGSEQSDAQDSQRERPRLSGQVAVVRRVATLEPIFWSNDDGTVIVEDWAMRFLDGIQPRLKHWVPLLKPGKQGVLIVPIAPYWFDKNGENVQELNVGTIDKVLDGAPDLILQAVIDIHAYWRARRGQATTH